MTECSRRSVANMASQGAGSRHGKSGGGAGEVSCTNSQFTEGISTHKFPDSDLKKGRHKK